MTGQAGTIYMLHFLEPYRHARHYVGWTDSLTARLDAHQRGHGARLLAIVHQAGIGFVLARTTTGDRHVERAIKNAGGSPRYCPVCTPYPRNGRWS
jgi:predicted GIY-YIG superfamily endonuclease